MMSSGVESAGGASGLLPSRRETRALAVDQTAEACLCWISPTSEKCLPHVQGESRMLCLLAVLWIAHNPVHADHRFRWMSSTHYGACRPSVPAHGVHPSERSDASMIIVPQAVDMTWITHAGPRKKREHRPCSCAPSPATSTQTPDISLPSAPHTDTERRSDPRCLWQGLRTRRILQRPTCVKSLFAGACPRASWHPLLPSTAPRTWR